MYIYTIQDAARIALKLVQEGMPLKHAVHLTASSYGFEPDDIFRELAHMELTA